MFARFFFPDISGAAEGLIAVLEHARHTENNFSFGPIDVRQIFESGLWIDGDGAVVADIVGRLPGVTRTNE